MPHPLCLTISPARLHTEGTECCSAYKALPLRRAAQDAEAEKLADRAAMLAARRMANRAALKVEPAAGTMGTTALRVRLPDGSTHMRRFASAGPLQVRAYIRTICLEHVMCLHRNNMSCTCGMQCVVRHSMEMA